MNRGEFIQQYLSRKNNFMSHMSHDDYIKAHQVHIDNCTARNPVDKLIIPIEEMSELTQELSKILRGKSQADSTNYGLLEELADVQIIIDSLKLVFDISDDELQYAIDVKMARNLARIQHDISEQKGTSNL